jgi:hypothetical protein
MLASSGEITPPCGVPASVVRTSPSSITPARNHWRINFNTRRPEIRSPHQHHQLLLIDAVEVALDVCVHDEVMAPVARQADCFQGLHRAFLRPEPKARRLEVRFEDRLDDDLYHGPQNTPLKLYMQFSRIQLSRRLTRVCRSGRHFSLPASPFLPTCSRGKTATRPWETDPAALMVLSVHGPIAIREGLPKTKAPDSGRRTATAKGISAPTGALSGTSKVMAKMPIKLGA